MKKIAFTTLFALLVGMAAQGAALMPKDELPPIFKRTHRSIAATQKFKQVRGRWKADKQLFTDLEMAIIGYYAFNPKGKADMVDVMTSCSVDSKSFGKVDAQKVKSAFRAVEASKVNVAYKLFKEMAQSGTTSSARKFGKTMVDYIDKEEGLRRGGSQSTAEINGLLGKIIGGIIGGITAIITGNPEFIVGFVAAGAALGDLTEEWIKGDGVMARPDGKDCQPPYFEF